VTTTAGAPGTRRRYDSAVRRARAAQTRDSIIAAAAELLQDASIRDWQALTIRAVAARAGVHERTVYRHFTNERALHDAVMQRLEADAGVDLTRMDLDDVGDVAARTLRYVSRYRMQPRAPLEPTLDDAKQRQHDALLAAVTERVTDWPEADRTMAAAMFDVLWAVGSFERLVVDWELDRDDAIRAITWVIGLVQDAVEQGQRPPARP
jgi:AcrR family transcriptional regulator